MSRINVEDSWFLDETRRRVRLIAIVGSDFAADGLALAAWRLSQKWWKNGLQCIPHECWPAEFDPFIAAGCAERREDGIYVRGSLDAFAWLKPRQKAASTGGIESGKTRRAKAAAKAKQNEAKSERNAKQTEANAKQNEANAKQTEANAKQTEANAKQTEANVGQAAEANAKQTEANAKQTEANAKQTPSKTKSPTPSPTPSPSQQDNPLSPPRLTRAIGEPRRESERALRDEAIRITEAVLSIALDPPPPEAGRAEAEAEITRRVPAIGRRVVERKVGRDGWPGFVQIVVAAAQRGNITAIEAQLRRSIEAELRAAAPVEVDP